MSELTSKLEGLLEAQAMGLAQQHLETGQHTALQIQQETEARLQRLQDGEEQRFQHEAEQRCRQLLQGAKLRMDAESDRVRWALAQDVLSEVRARLEKLPEDRQRYRAALAHYLAEAAAAIPGDDLVAELLPRDIEQFRADWDELAAQAAPGRRVTLTSSQGMSTGGMRVTDAAGNLRLDNTFEGRLARMEHTLLAGVMEILFAEGEILGSAEGEILGGSGGGKLSSIGDAA